MCGIIGFMQSPSTGKRTERNQKLTEFIRQGLFIDTLRGADATGVFRVDEPDKEARIFKRALAGPDYLELPGGEHITENAGDACVVVGHNRAGTRGANRQDRNAHPFQAGPITLVHNGTLTTYHGLAKQAELHVDSAHIAAALSERPAEEVLPALEGSYALVWHDTRDHSLNFARNNSRPLWWLPLGPQPGEWDGVVFGSEVGMLYMLLSRLDIPYHGKFTSPSLHTHWKYRLDNLGTPITVAYTPTPPKAWGGHQNSFTRGATTDSGASSPASGAPADTGTTSGTGFSRKELKRMARLAKIGVRTGERLRCNVGEWKPYKHKSKRGTAIFRGERGLTVEVAAITEAEWRELGNHCYVRAITARAGPGGALIVVGDSPIASPGSYSNVVRMLRGPGGVFMSTSAFKSITDKGCTVCGGFVNPEQSDNMLWKRQEGKPPEPVCHECTASPTVRAVLNQQAAGVTH